MNKVQPPSPLRAADYEAIEAALMESARGRWFLSEFAKRNRSSDTSVLLDAITRLETVVMRDRMQAPGSDVIRRDLIEMSEAIARTRREIAAIRPPDGLAGEGRGLVNATEELDAIVESTETATSEILTAAEEIQETAWQLREKGVDEIACDRLDQRATDIYTACSFQDITGQRTSKVVQILRYLEQRVNAMVDIWGLDEVMVRDDLPGSDIRPDAHLLNGPQFKGHGLEQNAIDTMIDSEDLFDDVTVVNDIPEEETGQDAGYTGADGGAVYDVVCVDDKDVEAETPHSPAAFGLAPTRQAGQGVVDVADFEEPEPLAVDTLGRTKAEAVFG
ncbi:MAG: chemotaxis protein [Hyphomicrobiales bacterium]